MIIAWFALLFTGRYPQGMYDFVAGALRYATRVCGYAAACSPTSTRPSRAIPPTPYPVDLNIGPPKARVQPAEGPLPDHPRDPGADHPATRCRSWPRSAPSSRGSRSCVARAPAEGPAGHDRARAELPAARVRLLRPAHRGLAALHRRDDGRHASRPRRRSARWPPARRPRGPSTRPRCRPAATPRPSARRPSRPRPARPSPTRRAALAEPAAPEAPADRAVVHGGARRVRCARAARAAEPEPEPPSEPGPTGPTSGDPLGGRRPHRRRRRPSRRPSRARPPRATGPIRSPRPARPRRATGPTPSRRRAPRDDDEDEPPPGPFGPSSTNPVAARP